MKELITIHPNTPINNKPIPTVSARELHRFMEVQTLFKDWIARRIEDFEYEKDRDFIVISGCSNLSDGEFNPNPPKEYYITLDMAKELAEIADLAQREPREALMRILATTEQPGAREIRMAVLLFCEGLAVMYDMEDEAGGHWDDLSEGGTA